MRVLHIQAGNLYGGVESNCLTLFHNRDFCPQMETVFALCFKGRLFNELKTAGAPVRFLGNVRIRHPLSLYRVRQTFKALLQRERFDVVIVHSAWSQAIFGPVVRAAGVPLVYWFHEPMRGKHWLERWARTIKPTIAICNSLFTASTIHNMYKHVRTELLYNPVAASKEHLSEATRVRVRNELKTSIETVVIVQVSRMVELKGHATHLEALSKLKDLPNWVCWQIGGAQQEREVRYFEKLKTMVERFGLSERVLFLGERADVPKLLMAADIYCQPNVGPESFGNIFIEALSAQLPVVTTAIGGAKEIIDDTCGILIPPNDVKALAASLRQLILSPNLRLKLKSNGPSRALQFCDVKVRIKELNDLLLSLSGKVSA